MDQALQKDSADIVSIVSEQQFYSATI